MPKNPATESQIRYLDALLADHAKLRKAHPGIVAELEIPARPDKTPAGISSQWASTGITQTKLENRQIREKAGPATPAKIAAPHVPDGKYAIKLDPADLPEGDDGFRFYSVRNVTKGKWAGYTFVDVLASVEEYPIRSFEERARILGEIAKDTKGALAAYGVEIGYCGHCSRELTDPKSRAIGIGPKCRAKLDVVE